MQPAGKYIQSLQTKYPSMLEGTDGYIAGAVAGSDKIFYAAYWKNNISTILGRGKARAVAVKRY